MKKILCILSVWLFTGFVFSSCSKDEDDNGGGNNNSRIIGVWTETDYWDDGALSGRPNTWHTWGFYSHPVHEFKSDKTYKRYSNIDDYLAGKVYSSGTYTFDGQNLAINGGFKRKVTFSESGDSFEWEKTAICARYGGK